MLFKIFRKEIVTHLFFVTLFLVIPTLAFVRPPDEPFMLLSRVFVQDTIANFVLLCFFYLNYYLLLPKLFLKRKYVWYILSIITFLSITLTLPHLAGKHLPFIEHDLLSEHFEHSPPHREFTLLSFMFDEFRRHLFLFFTAIFFAFLLRTREHLSQLKEEKIAAELSSLKAQINPHFLFNTLNSIYSLVVKKDDKAADAIINLSGLMRYAIKEANDTKISLQKELEYLRNYIELQRSRLGNTATIIFTCTGNENNREIAPLILVTYIENAIKYGINPDVDDCVVEINIQILNNNLSLYVFNKKVAMATNSMDATGIGMRNTDKRLQLIYPNKHTVYIQENEASYTVRLSIELI
jgi:Histidine kinase